MKKKIVALCLIVVLAASAVIGGTLAYFTDKDEATNTFTVGNVAITLTEPNWAPGEDGKFHDVFATQEIAKDPTVTNDGSNPCYVRVKVEGLDCLGTAGMITLKGTNAEDWIGGDDGYFYYTKILNKGESTSPVFTHIVMPEHLENLEEGVENEFNVVVYAEAIQAQGFEGYMDAFANFKAE